MKYPHWEYAIGLDSDLKELSRYIEISDDNYKTYSIELVRILLSACSEIDVVAKLLLKKINPSFKLKQGILDYQKIIIDSFSKFYITKINVPKHDLELMPWKDWKKKETSPFWWRGHTNVKHQRDKFYKDANLENGKATFIL